MLLLLKQRTRIALIRVRGRCEQMKKNEVREGETKVRHAKDGTQQSAYISFSILLLLLQCVSILMWNIAAHHNPTASINPHNWR